MKKLLILAVLLAAFSTANASGDKKNNPMVAVTLGDGCVLVFADGIDTDECEAVVASPQSGKQFICDALVVCSRDD